MNVASRDPVIPKDAPRCTDPYRQPGADWGICFPRLQPAGEPRIVGYIPFSQMPGPSSWTRAVDDAARRMEGFGAPWCVGGGWAADLFLGRLTRPHADVDLVILRGDEDRLHAHLSGWRLQKVIARTLVDWLPGEPIEPPAHEIHAHSPQGEALEFLLNDHAGAEWVYRRDPAVRCPLGEVIRQSDAGIPILCPAVVLLFKSKAPRESDEHDFRQLLPALPYPQRRWLRDALRITHPGHPWLPRL